MTRTPAGPPATGAPPRPTGAGRAPAGTRRTPPAARLAAALAAAVLTVLPAGGTAQADSIRDADWALDALHASEAWRTSKGAGVIVAVLDTGVDGAHPDLAGQVLAGKDMVGFGAARGDSAWARHGTQMAGAIAGHGHGADASDGVMGIAPESRILPVRVILEDRDPQRKKARTTRGAALAEGIRWAAEHGADVINLSLGDDSKTAHPEKQEDEAVQYALRKGVVVVASAGNGGEDGDRASYPAAYPGVIAVTAVDRSGRHASFSTRRWYATVAAPGVDVVGVGPGGRYYEGWGTSVAAAYVSGTAALIRSAYPGLSPAQVKELLEDTARDTPAGGRSDALGTGLVDPAAALAAAANVPPQATVPSAAPFGRQYFGSGPTVIRAAGASGGGPADGLATVCAVAGAVLVALSALLRLGPRIGPGRLRSRRSR